MRRMYEGERKGEAGGRSMSRKDIFGRVRAQVMLIRRLSGQIRELSMDGIRSLRLDGVPGRAGGTCRGLDTRLEKKEALERMLRRESEILREYDADARREMDGMKPEHYAFCAMYYLGGFSLEETAEAIDRSLRQCARYKREIEAA